MVKLFFSKPDFNQFRMIISSGQDLRNIRRFGYTFIYYHKEYEQHIRQRQSGDKARLNHHHYNDPKCRLVSLLCMFTIVPINLIIFAYTFQSQWKEKIVFQWVMLYFFSIYICILCVKHWHNILTYVIGHYNSSVRITA